ncbi:hypothetical protein ACHWQZ_G019252 [Mnemiopsis leidyi]
MTSTDIPAVNISDISLHHDHSMGHTGAPFTPSNFVDNIFFVTSGICFLFGSVGNTIALKYYSSQQVDTPHRLYMWITSTDIFTSLAMLPMSMSYQQGRAPILFGDVGVCQAWGILWSITSRLSVFLVAILRFLALYLCCVIIPTVLPVIPTIISCMITVRALRQAGRSQSLLGAGRKGRQQATRKNNWATNTIILTCLVYLVCNVPFAVYLCFEVLSIIYHIHIIPVTFTSQYFRLFLGIFSVSVNAALNPVIYYYRFRAFKRYSKEFKRSVRNSVVENTEMVRSSVSAVIRRMSTASLSVVETEFAVLPHKVEEGFSDVIKEESEDEDSVQSDKESYNERNYKNEENEEFDAGDNLDDLKEVSRITDSDDNQVGDNEIRDDFLSEDRHSRSEASSKNRLIEYPTVEAERSDKTRDMESHSKPKIDDISHIMEECLDVEDEGDGKEGCIEKYLKYQIKF